MADTMAIHIERVAMVAWSEARHALAGVKRENAKPTNAPPIKISGSEPPIYVSSKPIAPIPNENDTVYFLRYS